MFQNPADGFCAERAHGSSGSAKRRRERRLRAWLRHERQLIALHLAEALHHSAGSSMTKVVERREGEGVEGERYGALRRQMPPPPGTRPAAMMEKLSQGFWLEASRQPGHVVPSLSLLVLADTTTDGVDSSSLRFLAAAALYSRKLDEEKVRKREEEEEEELKRIRNIPLNQLTPLQRQKLVCWLNKEKEKKKAKAAVGILPSTSSSSSGFSRKRKKYLARRRRRRRRRGKGRGDVVHVKWTLGDDFKIVSVFSAQLGSSVDTCPASVYGALSKLIFSGR